jgi:hypothetical protein
MWRCVFCIAAVTASAQPTRAQMMPGRDLLEFPIAAIAEAPALASLVGAGFWNPALGILASEYRVRVIASAMDSPVEQGVTAQLVAVSAPLIRSTTASVVVMRTSVADLPRTEGDPQSIGNDIAYGAMVASVAVARTLTAAVDAGLALRYQHGEIDARRDAALALDAGVVLHPGGKRDLRLAAATFLLRPGAGSSNGTRWSLAGDFRFLGAHEKRQLRAGYSYSYAPALAREHYVFLSARESALEINSGIVTIDAYGHSVSRLRLGVGLRSRTIAVGLAREANEPGIAPTYQVSIAAHLLR